jgi:hypothetical protein
MKVDTKAKLKQSTLSSLLVGCCAFVCFFILSFAMPSKDFFIGVAIACSVGVMVFLLGFIYSIGIHFWGIEN